MFGSCRSCHVDLQDARSDAISQRPRAPVCGHPLAVQGTLQLAFAHNILDC